MACDLACQHCRACAIPERHPHELTTEEAKGLLRQVRGFGQSPPMVVITGGDPMKRPDLFELIEYGTALDVPVSITPSGTPLLTRESLQRLKKSGITSMALSLDGAGAEQHDGFRGVAGTFEQTISAAWWAKGEGIPLQINTTVTEETVDELPVIYELLKGIGIMRWSLFFLIPVGRGTTLRPLTPSSCERILAWLYDLSQKSPFMIKTTEAHHFRRIAFQRMRQLGKGVDEILYHSPISGFGVNDGNGIVFVSCTGEIFPSGFLPVSAGNVRKDDLTAIYRDSAIFEAMRDKDQLKGKCGVCLYKGICGGSRSRAYAVTGDYLESDPLCAYNPREEISEALKQAVGL